MPTSGNRGNVARRSIFRIRGKSARSVDAESAKSDCGEFLHIGPALAAGRGLGPRAHSTLGGTFSRTSAVTGGQNAGPVPPHVTRPPVDRISLDRRGLSSIPPISGETGLRLLSLQHNLLSSLTGLASSADLSQLVFLDVYDNQIEKITSLDALQNLRVLLMGKNRIRRIEGLSAVTKLEVLDLHGNRITQATGLKGLNELKVLNLAGNQLRGVELNGLPELRELNLKRNKLRKVAGCEGAPKMQKLFLSNNDLQSIEDISTVALALSLREVTLDNNPVSLGGDCVSFLVSYLPNLNFLSQMQVTDQVRRAAMAWRHNKEANNSVFSELGEEADANARREQVISNARTNWELLRSQSKCLTSNATPCTTVGLPSEFVLEANGVPKSETPDLIKTKTLINVSKSTSNLSQKPINPNQKPDITKNHHSGLMVNNGFGEKRVNFSHRSVSQDTDISHSTSTSSELVRLPPILGPIIDYLEHPRLTNVNVESNKDVNKEKFIKRWESISSVDPVVNSSLSSLPTTTSESESEMPKKNSPKRPTTANRKRASFAASKSVSDTSSNSKTVTKNRSISDNSENTSILSGGTNLNSTVTNSSTSGSEVTNRSGKKEGLSRVGSAKGRHIKSATTARRALPRQQSRAVTAKPKLMKPNIIESNIAAVVNQPEPIVKDREQGGDWLVEVRGGQASVWGAGALRRLERAWPAASDVTTVHFHYVSFASICGVLPTIKSRFPNAVHFTLRACGVSCAGQLGALAALRGLSSLAVHREGNPLAARPWHSYALYRLAHWGLRNLDHEEVTDEDITAANQEFAGLSDVVLWSLPDSLLQPLLNRLQGEREGSTARQFSDRDNGHNRQHGFDKDGTLRRVECGRRLCDRDMVVSVKREGDNGAARCWLWNADSALRDVVAREALQWRRSAMSQEEVVLRHRGRAHLSRVLCLAADAAHKLKMLRRAWPALLLQLITSILLDYSNLETHLRDHMKELQTELASDTNNKK